MLKYLYQSLFSNSNECDIFSKDTLSSCDVPGGRITITGDGPVAELAFYKDDDINERITTRLIVKKSAELQKIYADELNLLPKRVMLLSTWIEHITADRKELVVFSHHPLGFVFEIVPGFPFEHLKSDDLSSSLGKLRYFQECKFIELVKKNGYAKDFLARAYFSHRAEYERMRNNVESACRAMSVVSLEAILGLPHKQIVYPKPQRPQPRCLKHTGIDISGCHTGGASPWTGRIEAKFGVIKIDLSRGEERACGVFTRAELNNEIFDQPDSKCKAMELLHNWIILNIDEEKKIERYFICQALNEVLIFNGDKNFPFDEMSQEIVRHQFFLEKDLSQFMAKNGFPLEKARATTGWTEGKLQCLASRRDQVQKWIDEGITLENLSAVDEKKFKYLVMNLYLIEEHALKFVTLKDIFGIPEAAPEVQQEADEEEEEEAYYRNTCAFM